MTDAKQFRDVTLGCPGAWAAEDAPADHYATRVGGLPNFPGSQPPADFSVPLCAACGCTLCLVLQAFAPLSSAEAGTAVPERLLFVFGCTRKGCATSPASWRALRCQLPAAELLSSVVPSAPAPAVQHASEATGADVRSRGSEAANLQSGVRHSPGSGNGPSRDSAPAAAPVSDDWGLGAADWSMEEPLDWGPSETPAAGGGFDFADLDAALDAATSIPPASVTPDPPSRGSAATATSRDPFDDAMEQPTSHAAPSSHAAAAGEAGPGVPVSCRGPSAPQLPAFYLQARPEPAAGDAARLRAAPGEEAHVHELLHRYGQEDAQGTAAAAAAASSSAGEGEWGVEAYEPDTARSADATFLKFTRRLQRCPGQCARYGFGQHVLWPTKPAPEPRPCEQCGGPRRLELQLMPGLMHALDEGLAWQAEHGAGQGPTIDDWNWLSIAVFTCAKSCSDGRGGVSVMQEQVDICLE